MNDPEFRRMAATEVLIAAACAVAGAVLGGWTCAALILLAGILCSTVYIHATKKRYERLQQLNTYLDAVLAGDYDLQPAENREGELSILHDSIYKTTVLLRTQNEQLKADKRYLADVMADISHQLKTPVTSMSIMNDLLEYEPDQAKRKEFVEIQRQELDKMSWLIQNLLKLSRLDADIVVLQRERQDIRELVEEALASFAIPMELKQIRAENLVKAATVNVDRSWTMEVFRNLLKNSIEHMGENGNLRIESEETSLYVLLRIADDGCGIAREDLSHIFERFYRGKDASPGSIGIGLALAKSILEKERAEIRAESEPGKGTTFEIRFYKAII